MVVIICIICVIICIMNGYYMYYVIITRCCYHAIEGVVIRVWQEASKVSL